MRSTLFLLLLCVPTFAAAADAAPVVTDSGLVFHAVEEGKGASPGVKDRVRVHYRGTFTDGREFDSSYARGEPVDFRLDQVIDCFREGIQRMQVGGKARLTCPPAIAYGSRGAGNVIPPDTTLMFEVELLDVLK